MVTDHPYREELEARIARISALADDAEKRLRRRVNDGVPFTEELVQRIDSLRDGVDILRKEVMLRMPVRSLFVVGFIDGLAGAASWIPVLLIVWLVWKFS